MITKQISPRILDLKVNKGLLFRLKRNGKYRIPANYEDQEFDAFYITHGSERP